MPDTNNNPATASDADMAAAACDPAAAERHQRDIEHLLQRIGQAEARLLRGDDRMGSIEASLASIAKSVEESTTVIRGVREDTADFVAFQADLLAGTRFLCRLAKAIQWVADLVRKNLAVAVILLFVWGWATHNQTLTDFAKGLVKVVIGKE